MRKIYLQPTSLVVNFETEQMILSGSENSNIGGTGEDFPVIPGSGTNERRPDDFEWESAPAGNHENDNWN